METGKAQGTWSLPLFLNLMRGRQGTRMQALLICIQPSLLSYTYIFAVEPGPQVAAGTNHIDRIW